MFPPDINGKSFVDSVSGICKPPSTSTPSQAQEAASDDKNAPSLTCMGHRRATSKVVLPLAFLFAASHRYASSLTANGYTMTPSYNLLLVSNLQSPDFGNDLASSAISISAARYETDRSWNHSSIYQPQFLRSKLNHDLSC